MNNFDKIFDDAIEKHPEMQDQVEAARHIAKLTKQILEKTPIFDRYLVGVGAVQKQDGDISVTAVTVLKLFIDHPELLQELWESFDVSDNPHIMSRFPRHLDNLQQKVGLLYDVIKPS